MMTTTYAGYSYALRGYILKVTAETAVAGAPGLALMGLPDDTRRLLAETVELVMKELGLVGFNKLMPGTIVRYERMNEADPRPENLDRFELRSLAGATTLAVMAEHQQALQIRTKGQALGPEHVAETVVAADLRAELGYIWESKLICTRGIAGIAHAASQAGLRILTADRDGPAADNVHPFPRSVAAETLSDAVAILTGDTQPNRPLEREPWETEKTKHREHRLRGERDITPEQLRILEIAVAGRHNLCITTPERSITTGRYAAIAANLMPELGWTESAEVTQIHSAALLLPPHERRVRHAPMRAPHFTTSPAGMTGSTSSPGELALCHHGILYLDDPAELRAETVIAVRAAAAQESVFHADHRNKVQITRHPSRFMLIVADPLGDTDTEYSHTGVPAGTLRHYRVSAININGTGPASERDEATTDRGDGGGGGTPTPEPQMQQSQTPLAASFVSVPATHDGETPFWLELSFDAPVVQGSKPHLRELLGVTGGSLTRLRRKDSQLDHWQIRIEPFSQNAVAVMLAPSPPCGNSGAVCTDDGRTFTTGLATQIHGPASGNNWSDDTAGTAVTPVPALPLAGLGILGLLLALLGSRRRLNDRRQLDASRGR